MTAYELYKKLEQKFEDDPTEKALPVCVSDTEWGEMEVIEVQSRPKNIHDGKPMNMIVFKW